MRTSFVLGKNGGALTKLGQLARFGLGGTVGRGHQRMSLIHEDDMNRVFFDSLTRDEIEGVYIATAPKPVSNKEFMKTLREALGIRIGLPAYSFLAKIAAPLLLKTDSELALYGRYCEPKRLLESGFEFQFPELREAFKALFSKL